MSKVWKVGFMSPIEGILKPIFCNKLGFKKIFECTFIGNTIDDTLELKGKGSVIGVIETVEHKLDVLKLSENPEYLNHLMRNIKKSLPDFHELKRAYVSFYFIEKVVKSEVWYITKNGGKNYKQFESKF